MAKTTDGGDTWEFRSNENGRPMYFSQIRVDPNDPEIVYVVDQRVHKSTDGGLTFETLSGYGHVDQHADLLMRPAVPVATAHRGIHRATHALSTVVFVCALVCPCMHGREV